MTAKPKAMIRIREREKSSEEMTSEALLKRCAIASVTIEAAERLQSTENKIDRKKHRKSKQPTDQGFAYHVRL